jgi:hypothetical protein
VTRSRFFTSIAAIFLLGTWSGVGSAADIPAIRSVAPAAGTSRAAMPDSRQLERDLQRLNWNQFRWVVESVPKLKAGVEAYGPMGWQYLRTKYPTYPWKKSIDRLDVTEKLQLVDLIRKARKLR